MHNGALGLLTATEQSGRTPKSISQLCYRNILALNGPPLKLCKYGICLLADARSSGLHRRCAFASLLQIHELQPIPIVLGEFREPIFLSRSILGHEIGCYVDVGSVPFSIDSTKPAIEWWYHHAHI